METKGTDLLAESRHWSTLLRGMPLSPPMESFYFYCKPCSAKPNNPREGKEKLIKAEKRMQQEVKSQTAVQQGGVRTQQKSSHKNFKYCMYTIILCH